VVAGPFRLDTGPNYAPATVPSPHWQPPAASAATGAAADARASAEPEPPLEPATVQDIPELSDDDFELDQAAIGAALDAAPQPPPQRAETVIPAPATRPVNRVPAPTL